MADQDKQSRTEQPSGKRLADARQKGNVPRSPEITSLVTVLAAAAVLYSTGGFMFSVLKQYSREIFSSLATQKVTEAGVYTLMLKLFATVGIVLAPFLLIMVGVVIAANASQGGITFASSKLALDPGRLDPLKGFKRLFNGESAFGAVKSFLKIAVVGYMAYRTLRGEVANIVYLSDDVEGITSFIGRVSCKIALNICGVMIILAVLDKAFVRWRFIQNLKMTRQEVKDEHKETEGDPKVKGRIKQLHYEQARRRLKKIIPEADVVITNPTHYAIALKYDREKMWAPTVIAKGADYLAVKIKEIARENGVALVENRFLARELYARVKEGEEIPEALYTAVAEVLAYVYGLKGKL